MIDSLSLRVSSTADFSQEFAPVVAQLRAGPVEPFRSSRFYRYTGDLRKRFDIDAVLHLEYKFGECTHKVEILDAGKKTVAEMSDIVLRIFDVNPDELELMRVDLAADVPEVPVSWFWANARFQYKQFSSRIEKAKETELEFIGMGSAEAQSLYAGRRPNCIRVYNKIAEWALQLRKQQRAVDRFNRGLNNFELTAE